MNLATINVEDRKQARAKFLEYRNAIRERHDAEDEQIMRGYRELARGRQLIHLTETIRADENHRPRLAIARADARRCFMSRDREGRVNFGSDNQPWRFRTSRKPGRGIHLPEGTLPETQQWHTSFLGQAIVPTIPPALRPVGKLDRFHILWEAEWSNLPPVDPALLRWIGGDLWAVLAIWDLTDLERAVLSGRNA